MQVFFCQAGFPLLPASGRRFLHIVLVKQYVIPIEVLKLTFTLSVKLM